MLTDRQTDLKRLIIAFRNFANAPINKPDHRALTCDKNVIKSDSPSLHIKHFTVSHFIFFTVSILPFVSLMSTW